MGRERKIGISTIVLPVDSVNSVLNLLRPSEAISNLTIIGSDNGLSPGRRQAIIWTNACILSIWPWGTNFSEVLVLILTFSSIDAYMYLFGLLSLQ